MIQPEVPVGSPAQTTSQPLKPSQLNEGKLLNDFVENIAHHLPSHFKAENIVCQMGGQQIPIDVHKINLFGHHYIASPRWASYDATLFWSLIAQEKPAVIVKLNQAEPSAQDSLYWPNKMGQEWKSMNPFSPKVKCTNIEYLNKDLIRRTFLVSTPQNTFSVQQLDFTGWPDAGIPELEAFEILLREVQLICPHSQPNERIFVHCGGGAGRTGTFLAAHSTCEMPIDAKFSDSDFFKKIITEMRSQRPQPMVETPEQYVFLHRLAARPPLIPQAKEVNAVAVPSSSLTSAAAMHAQIAGAPAGQMASLQAEMNRKERESYLQNLQQNVQILSDKLGNFENNADDIVQVCTRALIGLSQTNNYRTYDCPKAFDLPLKGLLGSPKYRYVWDNAFPDSKKLRKGAPLCIIKAMEMKNTPAQTQAFRSVEKLITDYLDNCQSSAYERDIRLVVYALSRAYYDTMDNKALAIANLRKWWRNSDEHLAILKSGVKFGESGLDYNIPI